MKSHLIFVLSFLFFYPTNSSEQPQQATPLIHPDFVNASQYNTPYNPVSDASMKAVLAKQALTLNPNFLQQNPADYSGRIRRLSSSTR